MKHYKQKINSVAIPRLVWLALALVVLAVGVSFSRYVITQINNQVLVPENFYFESNYLTEAKTDDDIITYNVYTDSVTIEIRNHDLVQYTEGDITYTLTCDTESAIITIDGKKVNFGSDSDDSDDPDDPDDPDDSDDVDNEFTLATTYLGQGDDSDTEDAATTTEARYYDTNTFTLTATEGSTITITATSTAPYAKTITASFQFQDPGNRSFYEIVDEGYYCSLNLYTGEDLSEGFVDAITVKYVTEIFSPDNQNPIMADWKIDSLYEYEESANSDTSLYDVTDIWTDDATAKQSNEIAVYAGDTADDAENAVMPTETELVPNGYYSLVFFENTLGDYAVGQTLLGFADDVDVSEQPEDKITAAYTITMPTPPTVTE